MKFKYFILFIFSIAFSFELIAQDNASEVNTLLSRLDESQDENKRASIRLELARLYRQQNNFDESIRYYILAKHILDRTKKEVNLLALINEEIGLLYQSQKGYEKSISYFKEARSLRKRLNDTDGQIRALNYAAWSFYQIPHYSSAIQTYEEILDIHNRQKNYISEVKILNRLAIISELNGQLDQALEYSNRELTISRSLNNLRGLAKAHNNIAYLQRRKGLTNESLKSFNQAIDIYKKMLQQNQSQDEKATILSNLGVIHTNIGAYAPAYDYFGQALQIRRAQQDPAKIGNVFNQIAANYFLKGDFERARINALSAVKQARVVDAWDVLIDSYRILADISEAEGNIQDYRQYSEYQTELENKLKEESNKRDTELLRKSSYIQSKEDDIRLSIKENELQKERAEKAIKEKELAQQKAIKALQDKELAEKEKKLAQARAERLEKDRQLARAQAAQAQKDKQLARAAARQAENEKKIALLNEEQARNLAERAKQAQQIAEFRAQQAEEDQKKLIEQQKRRNQLYLFSAISGFLILITLFISFFYLKNRQNNKILKSQNDKIQEQNVNLAHQKEEIESQRDAIEGERKKSDELLLNILPWQTAKELKEYGKATPRFYKTVTVLFTDFKGFTRIASLLSPSDVVKELESCFTAFDEIIERHGLEKIKTIGDAYMCAGGIPVVNQTNPIDAVKAGLEIQQYMEHFKESKMAKGEATWEVRLGIHTGSVVAGVIGKKKFAYDIWGDAVNVASRMETSGEVGKVNISGDTYELVKDIFDCSYRGKIPAKNRGEVDMYFVNGLLSDI